MSLKSYLKGIADAIRNKKGTTDVINAQNFTSEINDIMSIRELVMERKNADNLFRYYTNLTYDKLNSFNLDTSLCTSMSSMFYNCINLTAIPKLDISKASNTAYMFGYCTKLTTVELDIKRVSSSNGMFINCINLTNLKLLNIGVKLQVGSGSSYGHLLTLESLIGLCRECIKKSSSTTLTVGTANLEKLADIYVKFVDSTETTIDTNSKGGDIVQCESTNEGAMTINAYMNLKNWALA